MVFPVGDTSYLRIHSTNSYKKHVRRYTHVCQAGTIYQNYTRCS